MSHGVWCDNMFSMCRECYGRALCGMGYSKEEIEVLLKEEST